MLVPTDKLEMIETVAKLEDKHDKLCNRIDEVEKLNVQLVKFLHTREIGTRDIVLQSDHELASLRVQLKMVHDRLLGYYHSTK